LAHQRPFPKLGRATCKLLRGTKKEPLATEKTRSSEKEVITKHWKLPDAFDNDVKERLKKKLGMKVKGDSCELASPPGKRPLKTGM
jgi:hypothetical protein